MDSVPLLFWIFSATTLFSAVRVITARNPVHAVLYLVLAFFSAACLWLLLQAEFLAIVLVLVYVGAVMVLVLFVVMMLDIHIDRTMAGFWRHLPVAGVVAAAIALQLWLVLANGHWQFLSPATSDIAKVGNTKALGILTFTEYVLPLQLAGAILISFLALPLRGLIAARLVTNLGVIPVQVLDGVGAGLQSVAVPGLVARILRGTGRLNVGQGAVMTVQGLGASLSPAIGGWIAEKAGYPTAFSMLGSLAFLSLSLWTVFHVDLRSACRAQAGHVVVSAA